MERGPVAQASKPAVSPTSKSAACRVARASGGFGNPRYSRLGSLRYRQRVRNIRAKRRNWRPLPVVLSVKSVKSVVQSPDRSAPAGQSLDWRLSTNLRKASLKSLASA